jgi:hypothetical protein
MFENLAGVRVEYCPWVPAGVVFRDPTSTEENPRFFAHSEADFFAMCARAGVLPDIDS